MQEKSVPGSMSILHSAKTALPKPVRFMKKFMKGKYGQKPYRFFERLHLT